MQEDKQMVETFGSMGKNYQERVVHCLLHDFMFAEQISDVLNPNFFELKYLKEISKAYFNYKQKYKSYPSMELIEIMLSKEHADDHLLVQQIKNYLNWAKETITNGDKSYIEDSSLDFCKRQTLREALTVAIEKMEESDYDSIQSVIKEALNRGSNRDVGHEYMENFGMRSTKSLRKPMATGWPTLDKMLNGGWERGTLTTFIAPTGAGKSMFLVNCSAAAVAQGYNALYITLEMADYKIGLRHDSYFSGVEINNVPDQKEQVETSARDQVKGRLFIKEFPTKTASVQTIRSYIQRLFATKNFKPDILVIDYADLLRSTRGYGEKRHELESVYEELRALSQELGVVLITADQTNRSGLNEEIVTLSAIAEAYSKATVCDLIITVSRTMDDKQKNCGRVFIAKSRLGCDGVVLPFLLNTATVKVTILSQNEDPISMFMEKNVSFSKQLSERAEKLLKATK